LVFLDSHDQVESCSRYDYYRIGQYSTQSLHPDLVTHEVGAQSEVAIRR